MNSRDSRTKHKVDVSRKTVPSTTTMGAPSSTLRKLSTHKDVPGGADSRAATSCCGRFQFTEGFLLDTVTGELWQFNKAAGALIAVPRMDTATGQTDIQRINERLQKAADAYAQMLEAINILS
jgi:hypothetical protein